MKKFVNKILDVPKLIRRVWILLWLMLIILLVMKFCFGIWYPIVIENEHLLNFNEIIGKSWARYIILAIFYIFSGNLLYFISCTKKKYDYAWELVGINTIIAASFIIKIINSNFSIIPEMIVSVVIPIVYLLKKYKNVNKVLLVIYPLIIQLLVFVWQLNIFLVRDIGDFNSINDQYFIIGFALQLDYYIFLTITYMGVCIMGLWSFWIFSKDVTALKAEKEKELAKVKPNMKKVDSLDSKIAELEKAGK